MKPVARWTLVAVVLSLPYLAVLAAGWWWLYEQGWLLPWAVLALVAAVAGQLLVAWSRQAHRPVESPQVPPAAHWTPRGDAAWQQVVQLSQQAAAAPQLPPDLPSWWSLIHQVLDTVARHFRPQSDHPTLEVPLPYLLRIIELVAADLRQATLENVPGSHLLTLNDLRQLREWAAVGGKWYGPAYAVYRAVRLGWNPWGGLLRELADRFTGSMFRDSTEQLRRWAICYVVEKAGYYAIEMYSGRLVLPEVEFPGEQTPRSLADRQQDQQRWEQLAQEPLRILVVGQAKSGKSSLVNALFGQLTTAVDVVTPTTGVTAFELHRDGLPAALVLDTAGYDAAHGSPTWPDLLRELRQADLVLLVCRATAAARASDRQFLDSLAAAAAAEPDHRWPPVVVALTAIDLLRPIGQWQPPYDLSAASTPKAQQIVAAIRTVAEELRLPAETVVPVCLLPERLYNVEEALVPAIVQALPEAERVRFLRCQRALRDTQAWQQTWRQAVAAGRFLLRTGIELLDQPPATPPAGSSS